MVGAEGRQYSVRAEVVYLGGTLPADDRDALVAAIRTWAYNLDNLRVRVTGEPYDTVIVEATTRSTNPLEALAVLKDCVDRSLLQTGLFERFDESGMALRAAPLERSRAASGD